MGYSLYRFYDTKAEAQKQAKKFHEKGKKTRIVRKKHKPSFFGSTKTYYDLLVK